MRRCEIATGILAMFILTLSSCGKVASSSSSTNDTVDETGQQIGDVQASIDESGGSGGTISLQQYSTRVFAKYAPGSLGENWIESFLIPRAEATTCGLASTFGSCSANTLTRTFGGCTIGGAAFDGTVTLTWGGTSASCTLGAIGDTITRVPSFTVTGRHGATLTVSKTGTVGQRLTWTSGAANNKVFSFTNDGIRRVFATSASATLFDFTTQTTSAMTVTKPLRLGRTLSGGTLRVTNNVTGKYCDYSPSAVTWATSCNCPVSGSWSGSCSDATTSTVTITGCGTGSISLDGVTQDITFDRCYAI